MSDSRRKRYNPGQRARPDSGENNHRFSSGPLRGSSRNNNSQLGVSLAGSFCSANKPFCLCLENDVLMHNCIIKYLYSINNVDHSQRKYMFRPVWKIHSSQSCVNN